MKGRSGGRDRPGAAILVAAALLLGSLAQRGATVALATDQATVAATIVADTLDPPTGLKCNAGLLSCSLALLAKPVLTWTATPDPYATGYEVWRSTTNGSGYAFLATVVGRTTVTWTDSSVHALTTYYYVVLARAVNWTSVYSNQVTVSVLL